MKRHIIYSILFAALFLASCKKYLDPDSPSVFETEYVFGTVDDATRAVNGVYALFNTDPYTSRLSNSFMGNTDVEVGNASASTGSARADIWSFEPSTSNADVLTVWNNAYNAINRANECIAGIKNSELYKSGNADVNQLLGEALTLRAFWYFNLVNFWGDVPLKTTPTRSGDQYYLQRTDRNAVLDTMIQSLVEIEPKMQWSGSLNYGIERVSREFTMGMIARLALARGGYALYPGQEMKRTEDYKKYYRIADEYCKKIRDSRTHVLTDYEKVFLNECQYLSPKGEDVIFEVAFQAGFGDVAWCNGVRVDKGDHPYGESTNYLNLNPVYYHSFDTLDRRLPVTCSLVQYDSKLNQVVVGYNSITPNKWSRLRVKTPLGQASAKGTGINWPVLRYADVLLMLAECENELNEGPTPEAIDALKEVRKRAFEAKVQAEKVDQYVASVSGSKEAFFNAIVNERAWEFGGECLRKFDLIRWNLYGKKIAELRTTLAQMGKDANDGNGDLPDYLYYKKNADKTVTFLDRYRKVKNADLIPIVDVPNVGDNKTGYYRANWLRSLYDTKTSGPSTYIQYNWRGYTDASGASPVRYILPLHSETISGSNGTLSNEGYGYK